jgi:hypothetical protein
MLLAKHTVPEDDLQAHIRCSVSMPESRFLPQFQERMVCHRINLLQQQSLALL